MADTYCIYFCIFKINAFQTHIQKQIQRVISVSTLAEVKFMLNSEIFRLIFIPYKHEYFSLFCLFVQCLEGFDTDLF